MARPPAKAPARRGRVRRHAETETTTPPPRQIINRHPKLALMSDDQAAAIHAASLRILETTGVIFREEKAVSLFRDAGTRVDGERIYIGSDLIARALETAPAIYTLRAADPTFDVNVGGDHIAVMPAGGPPFIYDLDRQRRPGTVADLDMLVKLAHVSPAINVVGRKMIEAQDVAPPSRHLPCWQSCLTLSSKPVQSGFVHGGYEARDVMRMLSIVHGGDDAVRGTPRAQTNVNVNSPLVFDRPMTEALMVFAEWGQPVQVSPFVMAGVSGPATMAGALAQHNAEILAGVVLTQLVRPGAPVLYGSATSNVDLRSGAPAIGSPESAFAIAASTQLARFHGLPSRAGGALTDSPIPDMQSAYERAMTLTTSVLSGVNFIMHGAGILESYLSVSPAQLVMDCEMLDSLGVLTGPLEVNEDTLALDVINAVGPGGMFLGSEHTQSRFRDVHFLPEIAVRQGHEQWQAEGGHDALARAEDRCRELLENYVAPEMNDGVREELDAFVKIRTRDIEGG